MFNIMYRGKQIGKGRDFLCISNCVTNEWHLQKIFLVPGKLQLPIPASRHPIFALYEGQGNG